jgi:hypothetical protein
MKKNPKFVMKITRQGMELVSGKWPTKVGQLVNGQLENGSKVQACMGRYGLVFYHGW